ncbi:MAG: proline--tRNA ligase [Methanobacteriota archaeon]|nr:MAG: proline--tRNA ligase [Euryarchaeota archaeon]
MVVSNFSDWYNNIMKEAELVDLRYGVKGFIVIRPWAMFILKKMYQIYEEELHNVGHMPVHFPAVIPESYLKKEEEHVAGFEGEVFWISKAGFNELEERLALRPTSETAMYPMYALWTQGKKDLPIKLYQSGTVWRYETKATKPLMRGREFLWIEAHCAFATKEGAENQVMEDVETTNKVISSSFGIPFLFFRRPDWDKFAGADYTCAADTLMPDGRVLQIATTHLLGQNFSKPFEVKFMDDDGEEKYVWQTSYGPGMNRILAALISIFGDEKGLVIPWHLSPVQAVIVPIFKEESKESIMAYSREVEKLLKNKGIRVMLDKSDETPGFKFNKWEQKGVPIRIEIGKREEENRSVTVVERYDRSKRTLPLDTIGEIEKVANEMFEKMKEDAKKRLEESIVEANTLEDMENAVKEGKIARVPFCSLSLEGKECYEKIKEKVKAEVRGRLLSKKEEARGNCIVCGKEAGEVAYVARQY